MFTVSTSQLPTDTAVSSSKAFSVTEINTMVADLLESGFSRYLWVEGEVSNLSSAISGHRYFSLKDKGSTISCALFRSSANHLSADVLSHLKNGDKIVVKASFSVYKPRGSYQLIVSDIEAAGFGVLARAYTELKAKLDKLGLTSSQRKRDIPTWPCGIAIVTSETGAAIRDVISTLHRRAPFIPVYVYPTLVQGDNAPKQIISALEVANNEPNIEVILLVRGGGSLEDLMAFNDESVAMALVNSCVPIVTGVGHETDFTIVDFVSDYRAPTPTASAEIVSPDSKSLKSVLDNQKNQLLVSVMRNWQQCQQRIVVLERRLIIQHPIRQVQQQSQRLDELNQRLQRYLQHQLQSQQQHLGQYRRQLLGKSPQQKLGQSKQHLSILTQRLQQVVIRTVSDKKKRLSQIEQYLCQFSTQLMIYRQQLKGLDARLTLLSPLGILDRGYAVVFDEQGKVIHKIAHLKHKDKIKLRLSDGEVFAYIHQDKK
ncbi:MAG: exodeoxyribonuclease VII large subunit [Ostreibacterium sp.]